MDNLTLALARDASPEVIKMITDSININSYYAAVVIVMFFACLVAGVAMTYWISR